MAGEGDHTHHNHRGGGGVPPPLSPLGPMWPSRRSNEVFTWGRGANGRLGHGDSEDRNIPTFVEGLKDRHVKNIACGSNYSASICIHKWVSGADQSVCTGCRQAFGFTRKRHNCYNCGLVHCHACSSKKALKAALAPTPGKPHRVCDSCYLKLKKASEGQPSHHYTKMTVPSRQLDSGSRSDRPETSRTSRVLLSPTVEPNKYFEVRSIKPGTKTDSYNHMRASQVPSLLQLKDIAFPSSFGSLPYGMKPPSHSPLSQQSPSTSRPVSPYSSRRPSSPRSPAPVVSRGVIDGLKATNEFLNQEVNKLQIQVRNIKQKSDFQDTEIQKMKKNAEKAASLATERLNKCNTAIETIKSINVQLKEVTEKLPSDIAETVPISSIQAQVESFLNNVEPEASQVTSTRDVSTQADDGYGIPPHESNGSSIQEGIHHHQSGAPRVASMEQMEVTEQFEPGVHVTFLRLSSGAKIFKRVRFRRRFKEQQAEEWLKENRERMLRKYNTPLPRASTESSVSVPTEENKENTA